MVNYIPKILRIYLTYDIEGVLVYAKISKNNSHESAWVDQTRSNENYVPVYEYDNIYGKV